METRHLKVFRAIARHGGLVRAARELCLSTSALSCALKLLEAELGCRLFERTRSQMVLTYAGEQLLASIEEPLQAIETAAASLRTLGQWGQSRLRIGAPVTLCQQVLPTVLQNLRGEFPKTSVVVETGNMTQLISLLQESKIDLAVGVEPENTTGLEVSPLFEDELLFVLSAHHPWATGRPLSRTDLRQQPQIVYHRRSRTAQLVSRYFQDLDVDPLYTMEIASISAIKAMVQLNLGVSVLAPWVLDNELRRGILKMRPLGPKALRRRWVTAHLVSHRLSLTEARFCRLCRAQVSTLRLDRKDLPETGRLPMK